MNKVVFNLTAVVALGGAVAFACTGPSAGEAVFTDGESTNSPKGKGDGGGSSSGESSTSSSGGAPAGDDPFFKTAFAYTSPGVKASGVAAHGGAVEGDGTATAPPKDCVTAGCHEGGANPFSAGGSIFAASAGGKVPAGSKFEIGINKPDGTLFGSAYSDEDGNFWIDTAGPIPDGSKVAIRKEGGKSTAMNTPLTAANKGGGCNAAAGCHGGAALRIYAP